MERDTGETDENVNREEEDVENHRKSAPLHLFVKLVRQQKSKTCHACEREKERRARVRGSHYFKAAGHNKIVWSRNWKKKKRKN